MKTYTPISTRPLDHICSKSKNVILNEFITKLVRDMKDPDPDAERILQDNIWDLI